jgi:hypothetical protein
MRDAHQCSSHIAKAYTSTTSGSGVHDACGSLLAKRRLLERPVNYLGTFVVLPTPAALTLTRLRSYSR